MKVIKKFLIRFKGLKGTFLLISIGWTLALFLTALWSINQSKQDYLNTLQIQSKTAQEKDLIFRRWVSLMGGVYVPVSENLKPNPFLAKLPERDVTTLSGKVLTLVNPALMMWLVYELEAESFHTISKLTSLKPINPVNAPSVWEKQALESFERGSLQASAIDTIDGEEYYRFIQSLITDENCLKCHAYQGYKVGDIRGGISISIPTKNLKEISSENINSLITQRSIMWFLGIIGIFFAFIKINKSEHKRNEAETRLRSSYEDIENQIKEKTKELFDANILFESILNSAGEGIYGVDLNGNSTFVNNAAAKMLGYEIHELLNIETHANHHYKKADGSVYEKESCPMHKAFTEGQVHSVADEVFWRKDGSSFPVKYISTPLIIGGEIKGVVVVFADISERKQAEEEIKQLNAGLELKVEQRTAELAAANKELEAFSYTVSHDLRAPLRHINGFIDLLSSKFSQSLDDKAKRYLTIIQESATRMGMLIDDLLSFSRIGRSTVNRSKVNMNGIVKSVLSQYTDEVSKRNIKIDVADLPEINADSNLIMQVWANLISNAIKYTGKTDEPKIEIGFTKDNELITYFVKDNGAGFDMEYYDKLFGVFQRLHSSDEFEGTGIGLANIKRIIDKHNGKVWAEGKVNEGATFYFSLPIE